METKRSARRKEVIQRINSENHQNRLSPIMPVFTGIIGINTVEIRQLERAVFVNSAKVNG